MTTQPSGLKVQSKSRTVQLETISLHGHEVSYWTGGSGPVLVLIHGLAGDADTWQPVLERLCQSFTVIAPDLPGHGRSAKPRGDYSVGAFCNFVRDLMVQLGYPTATIVGQSLGGGIAMQFAYQHPEFCERLVLISSGGLGEDVSWALRALAAPGMEYLLPLAFTPPVRFGLNCIVPVLSAVGLHPTAQLAEIWRAYKSLGDQDSRSAFVHTIRSVIDLQGQRIDATNRLHLSEDVPTLIVWGERDPIIPVSHGHHANEHIPQSRLEIFEKSGHFPHCEEPKRFAELLEDFLATTEPTGSSGSRRGKLGSSAKG